MAQKVSKLNPAWITETRQYFLEFLRVTKFTHPQRNGVWGSTFAYLANSINFIRYRDMTPDD